MKLSIVLAGLTLAMGVAYGHSGHAGVHLPGKTRDPQATSFGVPGDPSRISHTVSVEINDTRCRHPAEGRFRQGETVRFVVRNSGTRMHELVLGTSHELGEHAARSEGNPEADHDDSFILHVEPGTTEALVWRFTRVGLFSYECLIRGAKEVSMTGRIVVTR
jgi:uncharacterized cupredoxin-like copper-binding protein